MTTARPRSRRRLVPLRRLALALALPLLLVGPAAADQPSPGVLDTRIAGARAREALLAGQIESLTGRIRTLEAQAGDVSTRLASLEDDLRLHQRRLSAINALLSAQGEQLRILKGEYATASARLRQRLVQIYEEGEPSTLEIVLGARSLAGAIDRLDYQSAVARQDREIVTAVAAGRARVRAARARAGKAQRAVASELRVVAYRRDQAAALRDRLLSSKRSLAGARDASRDALAQTKEQEQEWLAEAAALRQASADVSSRLSSSSPQSPPSSAGLVWPVSGPITSPFGMRWGSLHPGIDIGVGMGTPIRAAAAGRVVVAAYSGGYGNLIVVDHGGGLATAYAHQSRFAVPVGAQVAQGQVIGYVGSTGFSTGPHLHFEVRVNGTPVDPLGYL